MEHIKCTFSAPGTYGHECGRPATHTAVRELRLTANLRAMGARGSKDGMSYAPRCGACAKIQGGENAGAGIIDTVRTTEWV